MCESAAPSTTNQNATQGIYIKDKRWLESPYRHTELECSMKLYLKVIGCSCYTCLPQSSPAAARTALQKGVPGTRPKAQRLLTLATPKHGPAHTHTCKQRQKIRNSTTLNKNSAQNYDRTLLRVTTIA
jgi:hypothetical protein